MKGISLLRNLSYLKFDGLIVIPNWEWELLGGVDANLGFEVEILSFNLLDYYTTLENWETTIASDNGQIANLPPNTPSITNAMNLYL